MVVTHVSFKITLDTVQVSKGDPLRVYITTSA